ncbi:MAG: hypothetical protein ACRDZ8_00035 [Acidimicrobiales bacterium]
MPGAARPERWTCYGLHKYLRLALNGNPSIIAVLFVPKEYRVIDQSVADELRAQIPTYTS